MKWMPVCTFKVVLQSAKEAQQQEKGKMEEEEEAWEAPLLWTFRGQTKFAVKYFNP